MEEKPISYALHLLQADIRRFVDIFSHKKEIDTLTGSNTWVLRFLASQKDRPVYLRDVEQHFHITRSTASKVVDQLVKKGLVNRQIGITDGRLRQLTLTPQAESVLAAIQEDHRVLEKTLTQGFTNNEISTLLMYLSRLQRNLEKSFNAQEKNRKES